MKTAFYHRGERRVLNALAWLVLSPLLAALIASVLVFALIFIPQAPSLFPKTFTSKAWKKADPYSYDRLRMAKTSDLADTLVGMCRKDVFELLGEPYSEYTGSDGDEFMRYIIGRGTGPMGTFDPNVLYMRLDADGCVTEAGLSTA